MKSIIEFYYQEEVIERREFDGFFVQPCIGDAINLQFSNSAYNEYGNWWIIQERRIIYFSEQTPGLGQTLMVRILPDPNNGLWRNDPLFKK